MVLISRTNETIEKKGIFSVATIRANRITNSEYAKTSKIFKKSDRGIFEQIVTEEKDICVVRWMDSKPVHMISSFLRAYPTDIASKFDRAQKKELICHFRM